MAPSDITDAHEVVVTPSRAIIDAIKLDLSGWPKLTPGCVLADQALGVIEALDASQAELVSALKPFAEAAVRLNGDVADAVNIWPGSFTGEWFTGTKPLFNASDLRRANCALVALSRTKGDAS